MNKFISITIINVTSKENDTEMFIRAEDVRAVIAAVDYDRRQRKEVNSLLQTNSGTYATPHTLAEILERISECER